MPATKDGFEFQQRDAEIISLADQLQISTVEHLAAHFGCVPHSMYQRVVKLENQGYLSRITERPAKALYQLGPEAAEVLIKLGYAPESIASRRLRANELKPLGRAHALLIADIHSVLLLQAKRRPEKIALWRQDRGIYDKAGFHDAHGRATKPLPVEPDAYFILQHTGLPEGKNRRHFFLEADTGTMAHERIAKKIRAYRAYHDERRFPEKYPGMLSFSVLIVTKARRRADELQKDPDLQALIPTAPLQRAHRFIALDDLTLDALLSKPGAPALTT